MKRLKQLRNEKKISQDDFAKIFNATQSTVSGWETGTREPSYALAIEIANFFDVSLDYLFGNSGKNFSQVKYEEDISATILGLSNILKNKDISQKELAFYCKVSQPTVSDWVYGTYVFQSKKKNGDVNGSVL